jgi:hypothetical protein
VFERAETFYALDCDVTVISDNDDDDDDNSSGISEYLQMYV